MFQGFVPPRQIKAKQNDRNDDCNIPMQHHDAVLANENTLARLRTDLWSSPGNVTSQSSLQRSQHSGTKSYDTGSHSQDPWRRQNDGVNVSLSKQGSRIDRHHNGQSAASSYWQDNLRSQDTFTRDLINDDPSEENNSWDVSSGKKEADHQSRAKRSSSQILALIGKTTPVVDVSRKTPGGRNDDVLVEVCESVQVTNATVCEVRVAEYSDGSHVCGTSESVDETMANVTVEGGVGGEDVERSDETSACLPPSKEHSVQQHTSDSYGTCSLQSSGEQDQLTTDGCRSDNTLGRAVLEASYVDCVDPILTHTELPHMGEEKDAGNIIEAGVSVDIIGNVSQESGSNVYLEPPMDEMDADSEQMCFDICFSPLSECPSADTETDQPAYDAAMDHPSDDECLQDVNSHTSDTTNQCSDKGDDEAGLDVSTSGMSQPGQSDRMVLMSPTGSIDVVDCAATTVVCDADTEGLHEPITDCHTVSSSGDCHIVNYRHTREGGNIERCDIRGGDITSSDGNIISCDTVDNEYNDLPSPCANVVHRVINKNCTTPAEANVTCHTDDICHTGEANVATCDTIDAGICPMDDTDTDDRYAADNGTNIVNLQVDDGNIVNLPLPHRDTTNRHLAGDVIISSNVQSPVSNVQISMCDIDGDNECGSVDNLDSNVDLGTNYVSSNVDSVYSPLGVTRRDNESCHSQTGDIGDLSGHVDNGECHMTDCVAGSCHFDVDCVMHTPAKSSRNEECSTDENNTADLTDRNDDGHVELHATCHSKINQENCNGEVDDNNYSCLVDTDFNADDKTDVNLPGEVGSSDVTVPEETYGDKVVGSSSDDIAFSEELEEEHLSIHEEQPEVSDHAMLEGFKSVSDVAASKCAEEDVGLSNDRGVDTDSVDTSDTMCSSTDSLPSNSQQWPDQRQMVQPDWPQHQRPICLPTSMSRTNTETPTAGIPRCNARRTIAETPTAGIPRGNAHRTITETPTAGIPRCNPRRTITETPMAGIPCINPRRTITETQMAGIPRSNPRRTISETPMAGIPPINPRMTGCCKRQIGNTFSCLVPLVAG